jgi:hypothetical protein
MALSGSASGPKQEMYDLLLLVNEELRSLSARSVSRLEHSYTHVYSILVTKPVAMGESSSSNGTAPPGGLLIHLVPMDRGSSHSANFPQRLQVVATDFEYR